MPRPPMDWEPTWVTFTPYPTLKRVLLVQRILLVNPEKAVWPNWEMAREVMQLGNWDKAGKLVHPLK